MSKPPLLSPLVSIVAPAHNAARFFDSWLSSITSQRISALEIILIDDGSSDDIADHVARCREPIRYLRQENLGPAAARNAGIRASGGDLIAFLDLDDQWAPRHLERCMNALQANPGAGIAQGRIRNVITDSDGKLQYCSPAYRFLNLGAAVFRRLVFETCGYFDTRLRFAEDFDFITRCWEQGVRKIDLEEVSLLYHRHESNMTNQKSVIELGAVRVYKLHLERLRAGTAPADAGERLQVGFPQYIGQTLVPHDQGMREPVAFQEAAR